MTTKKFNIRTGVKTGNIVLDAATDSIIVANLTASSTITAPNIVSTTKVSAAELSVNRVSSNIIPKTSATYDIGSVAQKFNDLHLSGNINIGTHTISPTATGVSISGVIDATTANLEYINANVITANSLNTDTVTVNTQLVINSTTDTTSTDTGSFVTAGGVGIMKDLYVGGAIHLANGLGGTTSKGSINYNDGVASIDFNFNG